MGKAPIKPCQIPEAVEDTHHPLTEVSVGAGAPLVKRVDFPKGHPENPLTDEEVVAKFERLTVPFFLQSQVIRAVEAVLAIQDAENP